MTSAINFFSNLYVLKNIDQGNVGNFVIRRRIGKNVFKNWDLENTCAYIDPVFLMQLFNPTATRGYFQNRKTLGNFEMRNDIEVNLRYRSPLTHMNRIGGFIIWFRWMPGRYRSRPEFTNQNIYSFYSYKYNTRTDLGSFVYSIY